MSCLLIIWQTMLANTFPGAKKKNGVLSSFFVFVFPLFFFKILAFCLVTKNFSKRKAGCQAKMPRFSFSNKKAARSDCSKRTCLVDILFGNSMMGASPWLAAWLAPRWGGCLVGVQGPPQNTTQGFRPKNGWASLKEGSLSERILYILPK